MVSENRFWNFVRSFHFYLNIQESFLKIHQLPSLLRGNWLISFLWNINQIQTNLTSFQIPLISFNHLLKIQIIFFNRSYHQNSCEIELILFFQETLVSLKMLPRLLLVSNCTPVARPFLWRGVTSKLSDLQTPYVLWLNLAIDSSSLLTIVFICRMARIHLTPRHQLMVRVKRPCTPVAELLCMARRRRCTKVNIFYFVYSVSSSKFSSSFITRLFQLEIVHHIIMVVPHLFTMALELRELGILLYWIRQLVSRILMDSIWTIRTTLCRMWTTFLRLRAVITRRQIIRSHRTILLHHLVIIVRWLSVSFYWFQLCSYYNVYFIKILGSSASSSSYLHASSPGGSAIGPYGTASPISYSPMTPGGSSSISAASPYNNPQTPGAGRSWFSYAILCLLKFGWYLFGTLKM